jgi:transposase-like protein
MTDLTAPMYVNEEAARAHLEAIRWPDGPACPHCGSVDRATKLEGDSTRPGVWKCREPECRKPFSVTVGTLFERSHIPLNKWLLAVHLLCASKKGISAHQLHRMLDVQYRTAWFMAHRIREAMRPLSVKDGGGPLGGKNKVVEADETYVGGKEANKHASKRRHRGRGAVGKEAVFALVERRGRVMSHHVPAVSAKTLRPILVRHASRKSYLMTDDSPIYPGIGDEFAGHGSVNHSQEEYVRGVFWHTNTVENYFSILKRGITGVYHHVSQRHLRRYLAEFDFRYNNRKAMGIEDDGRALRALKGIGGKRLTYRRTNMRPEA